MAETYLNILGFLTNDVIGGVIPFIIISYIITIFIGIKYDFDSSVIWLLMCLFGLIIYTKYLDLVALILFIILLFIGFSFHNALSKVFR